VASAAAAKSAGLGCTLCAIWRTRAQKRVKSLEKGITMWMLLLEAGIALSLFIFIMWWTLGPVKRREDLQQADLAKGAPPAQDGDD
jgi:hypothetical protein